MKLLDHIEIDLRGHNNSMLTVHIDVADNSLSRKWLCALNDILRNDLHLEKNYCWLGWTEGARTAEYLCTQINRSIHAINSAGLGYTIQDFFSPANTIDKAGAINHDHMNQLHRYFEDLQGVSGAMSSFYTAADSDTRWHIRQLFTLDSEDYHLFGIETINRQMGGVYVGVNKAVGKAHWEVFNDEGRDLDELTTTALRSQTEAAGDFDIEWARDPGAYSWQIKKLEEFRTWLVNNGFDPLDPELTIGHPQVAQVDLSRSFGTTEYTAIWAKLAQHLDVYSIRTGKAQATYKYHWSDADYAEQQIRKLS